VGVRVGVVSSIKTVGATVLGGLWALEWAWHYDSSIKTVGATVLGGLWALEWAWHFETNLRCVRSSGICTPNLNSLALIVKFVLASKL